MVVDPLASGPVEILRREHGYCVEGPGFYVWDEDPREVSRVARGLRSALPAPITGPPEPR